MTCIEQRPNSILIVDDQESNRYMMGRILCHAGLTVMEAGSGHEALARAQQAPSLILLDVHLPDLNGFEICRRIKSDPLTAAIPVLMISADFVSSQDKVQGLEGGADGYLIQPIRPEELLAHVQARLRIRQTEEELRRSEEALRESEAQFRQLADAMPQLVWITRPDGYHEYFNQHWYDFTGATFEESQGEMWSRLLHPDDCQRTLDYWHRCLSTGEPYEIEYRFRRARDGQYRWFLGRALPVYGERGKIKRWFGTCTEIHEQKMAQETLREADRRKDEFLAMLAHELRNPLAPIRYAVQMMNLAGSQQSQLQKQRDVIDRQVSHMSRLLDDLLEVSRITRGKIQLRKEKLDLRQVLEQVLDSMQAQVQERRLHLCYQAPSAPLAVEGDPTRLEQILRNLLHNAIKYTEADGCIWLLVEVEEGGGEAWQVVITVRDSGIGISPEVLPRVFDLFAQAEQGLDRSQGGLGIGLTMVKRLVELHNGRIEARSAGLGRGSEFVVRLPLAADVSFRMPAAKQPALPACIEDPRPVRRVLVVDDNEDSAASLGELLGLWGHEVVTVHDGLRALTAAHEWRPEVVLLDIGLPGMDGYEVARRLRHEPDTADVKLVALTGYGTEEDRRRALEAGFDHHLVKPVNLDQLNEMLARAAA